MIGEQVEGRLDLALIGDLAGLGAESSEKGTTERVAGEESVQVASLNPPVGASAAIRAACQAQHRPCETRPGSLPEMDFVTFDRPPGRKLDSRGLAEAFSVGENGVDL